MKNNDHKGFCHVLIDTHGVLFSNPLLKLSQAHMGFHLKAAQSLIVKLSKDL